MFLRNQELVTLIIIKQSCKDVDSKPMDLGWEKSVVPSWKSVLSSQFYINTMFIKIYGSHWSEKSNVFDSSMNKLTFQVLTVNGTVRYIPFELFKFAYVVERSLASLPATDTLQVTLHQVTQKLPVAWKNYWLRAQLTIPNYTSFF